FVAVASAGDCHVAPLLAMTGNPNDRGRDILARVHTNARSKKQEVGEALLKEEDAPNLSTKNFLNMPVNDAESLRSRQPTHILKVLGDGGPGEGAFIRKSPSPGAPTDARVGYTGSPRVLLCAKAGLRVWL